VVKQAIRCLPGNVAKGHFRPINDVGPMSAFHPIATKLLHHGERRYGPIATEPQIS
jgi:hypothetical protein